MARAGTVDALQSNYVRTAVLKGLPRRRVIWGHVVRNSMLPTITVVSVQVGYLVGGLVVVETLFAYPGIGQLTLESALGHDLPTLEACVLMIAIIYCVANLLADLAYGLLNPRVRLGRSRWRASAGSDLERRRLPRRPVVDVRDGAAAAAGASSCAR